MHRRECLSLRPRGDRTVDRDGDERRPWVDVQLCGQWRRGTLGASPLPAAPSSYRVAAYEDDISAGTTTVLRLDASTGPTLAA